MSLAGLQDSWLPTPGSVPTTLVVGELDASLIKVNGVVVNGLLGSGTGLASVSGDQDVVNFTNQGSVTAHLQTDSQNNVASFDDVVTIGAGSVDASFIYRYPVPFLTPPVLTVSNPLGGVSAIFDTIGTDLCSGYMRYATATNRSFQISGSAHYVPESVTIAPFPQWSPSSKDGIQPVVVAPGLLRAAIRSSNDVTPTQSFRTPADLDGTKVTTIKVAWGNPPGEPSWSGQVPILNSDVPFPVPWSFNLGFSTTGLPADIKTFASWPVPAPSGNGAVNFEQATNGFATEPFNQYLTIPVILQPNTLYYPWLTITYTNPPGGQPYFGETGNWYIDIASFSYWSTLSPSALAASQYVAPPPSAPVVVSGQRVLRRA